jgi:hypothetical protein
MNWSAVIRAAQRASQAHVAELQTLRAAIDKRLKVLAVQHAEERERAALAEVRTWKRGDDAWCNASGVFLGGKIQRGTHLTFWSVQPRKEIAWFKLDTGEFHWFSASGLLRYNLQRTAPADPVSPALAKLATAVGEVANIVATRGA